MSERAKGRLAIFERDKWIILDDGGHLLAEVLSDCQTVVEDIATARHITACWNAAEDLGLTTEQLEAGVLREMVEVMRDVWRNFGNDSPVRYVLPPSVRDAVCDVLAKTGGGS